MTKPDLVFRSPDAPPLELDNEPEDINSDGLQVYIDLGSGTLGVLVVPREGGGIIVRSLGEGGGLEVTGDWSRTDDGYLVTLRLAEPGLALLHPGSTLGFDLLINEMRPGRQRRAGQLVWSSHQAGWVYLRGDRHNDAELGSLELG